MKSFNDKFIKIIITEIFENLPIVDIGKLRGWYYMAIEIRTETYNHIINIADGRMEFMSEVSNGDK